MKLGEIMVFYAVLDFSHGDNHQGKIASQLICQLINKYENSVLLG